MIQMSPALSPFFMSAQCHPRATAWLSPQGRMSLFADCGVAFPAVGAGAHKGGAGRRLSRHGQFYLGAEHRCNLSVELSSPKSPCAGTITTMDVLPAPLVPFRAVGISV